MIKFVKLILYSKYNMINDHIIIENYFDTPRGNSDSFEDIPLSDYRKSLIHEEEQSAGCFCNLFCVICNFLFHTT